MTDWLRGWILSLAGTAVICAVASALTPKGQVKRVVELLCGIAMTAALLSPLLRPVPGDYALHLAQYRDAADTLIAGAEEISRNLDRSYIEAELEAYILDKAEALSAHADGAKVTLRWDTAGVWVPVSAAVDAPYHAALSRILEGELGIPPDAQTWRNDENT